VIPESAAARAGVEIAVIRCGLFWRHAGLSNLDALGE
jgi:hypothetical protein